MGILVGDEMAGDLGEFAPLVPVDRFFRIVFDIAPAGLDLDKHEDITVGCDDIDLADRTDVIRLDNPKARLLEKIQ